MEGGDNENDRGMIHRAVEKIFSVKESLVEKGWNVGSFINRPNLMLTITF